MLKLAEQLLEVMQYQQQLYIQLSEALDNETDALQASNINMINASYDQKAMILSQIEEVEDLRKQIVGSIAQILQVDVKNLRLRELSSYVNADIAKRLVELKFSFDRILADVKDKNLLNQMLADKALDLVNGGIQVIHDAIQGTKTYEKGGRLDNKKEQQRHLMNKKI